MELAVGVDVLLHDAQFNAAELASRPHYGHSRRVRRRVAPRGGVGRLMLFHHDPGRTDDEVDAIVTGYADAAVEVDAAREGETISC